MLHIYTHTQTYLTTCCCYCYCHRRRSRIDKIIEFILYCKTYKFALFPLLSSKYLQTHTHMCCYLTKGIFAVSFSFYFIRSPIDLKIEFPCTYTILNSLNSQSFFSLKTGSIYISTTTIR